MRYWAPLHGDRETRILIVTYTDTRRPRSSWCDLDMIWMGTFPSAIDREYHVVISDAECERSIINRGREKVSQSLDCDEIYAQPSRCSSNYVTTWSTLCFPFQINCMILVSIKHSFQIHWCRNSRTNARFLRASTQSVIVKRENDVSVRFPINESLVYDTGCRWFVKNIQVDEFCIGSVWCALHFVTRTSYCTSRRSWPYSFQALVFLVFQARFFPYTFKRKILVWSGKNYFARQDSCDLVILPVSCSLVFLDWFLLAWILRSIPFSFCPILMRENTIGKCHQLFIWRWKFQRNKNTNA